MAAEIHQSVSRRAAILRIIRESTVHNQDELVKVLRKQGFEATQSSVSRDLRELGVAKAGDRYIVPSENAGEANPFAAVANFVAQVRTAGPSLTVVKTASGHAQSVTVAIDQASGRFPATTRFSSPPKTAAISASCASVCARSSASASADRASARRQQPTHHLILHYFHYLQP
jgi:transcriptional regulator of arginine metabolism